MLELDQTIRVLSEIISENKQTESNKNVKNMSDDLDVGVVLVP